MVVRKGETIKYEKTTGSFNALRIIANIFHETANTVIPIAAFDPQSVNVKLVLVRDKDIEEIYNGNLLLLGTKNTFKKGYNEFLNGIDIIYPAVDVKAEKIRFADIRFGSILNLMPGDKLVATVSIDKAGAFTAAVDEDSFLEFEFVEAIGYENCIPNTEIISILEAQEKQTFDLGDNVTSIMLLNFDKPNHAEQVIKNLTLTSDRLDIDLSYNQLVARHSLQTDKSLPKRYGTALPLVDNAPTVKEGLPYLPQTFILFDGVCKEELDNCVLNLKFNPENLASSQNYIVVTRYKTSMQQLKRANAKKNKHVAEKVAKIS